MKKIVITKSNKIRIYLFAGVITSAIYMASGLRQSAIILKSPDSKNTAIVKMPAYILSSAYLPIYFFEGHKNAKAEIQVKNSSRKVKTIFVKKLDYIDDEDDSILWVGNPQIKWLSNQKFDFVYTEAELETFSGSTTIECDINKGCEEWSGCCRR